MKLTNVQTGSRVNSVRDGRPEGRPEGRLAATHPDLA
jgi:hypothetical protein